jgi:hypothetical protein
MIHMLEPQGTTMGSREETNRLGISAAITSQADLFAFLVSRGVLDREDLRRHAEKMLAQMDPQTAEGKAGSLPYKAILTALSALTPQQ